MVCEDCGKNNAVSIFISHGGANQKYLCQNCYKKCSLNTDIKDIVDLEIDRLNQNKVCNNCGTSFIEFKKSGLFGCENCYETFIDFVNGNILKSFKEKKYYGKKPNIYYIEKEYKNLEQLIEICLKNGDFARATKYSKELERLKEENYGRL